jgi:hypothetical protein
MRGTVFNPRVYPKFLSVKPFPGSSRIEGSPTREHLTGMSPSPSSKAWSAGQFREPRRSVEAVCVKQRRHHYGGIRNSAHVRETVPYLLIGSEEQSMEEFRSMAARMYYSRGFPVGGRTAAQRDVILAGAGYTGLPPFGRPGSGGSGR